MMIWEFKVNPITIPRILCFSRGMPSLASEVFRGLVHPARISRKASGFCVFGWLDFLEGLGLYQGLGFRALSGFRV